MKRRDAGQYALLAFLFCVLGAFLVYPIWLTVRGGVASDPVTGRGFTLRYLELVFRDPVMREGLVNALMIAIATTALCILISLPLGLVSARFDYRFKRFWDVAVLVPLILPPFVGAVGLKAMIGRYGALNSMLGTEWDILGTARFWGVVVTLALHLYPIVYLNVVAALANLDPSLVEAAKVGGATGWQRFRRITLPLIRPGVFAGSSIVLIWSFTELGTPLVFDYYRTTPVQIFNGVKEMDASAQPYALTIVMLGVAILMYATGRWVLGSSKASSSTRAFRAAETPKLGGVGTALANLMFGFVAFIAVIPHIGVILMSLSTPNTWYRTMAPSSWTLENFQLALERPIVFGSIINSLSLSLIAALVDVVLGVAIAWIIVRGRVKGRAILDGLAMLPLAVPGLVMAFGFIAMSLRWPFGKGDPLEGVIDVVGVSPNPMPLLVIAYAMRRLPYIVRAAVAGLEQVGVELEEAASVFGATTAQKFRRVVVPLLTGNLLAGALLVFSFSMLEVSDSLMLAQQEQHYPITKAIYALTERLGDGVAIASAMGVWGMALLTITLTSVSVLLGKKFGAIFRA